MYSSRLLASRLAVPAAVVLGLAAAEGNRSSTDQRPQRGRLPVWHLGGGAALMEAAAAGAEQEQGQQPPRLNRRHPCTAHGRFIKGQSPSGWGFDGYIYIYFHTQTQTTPFSLAPPTQAARSSRSSRAAAISPWPRRWAPSWAFSRATSPCPRSQMARRRCRCRRVYAAWTCTSSRGTYAKT